MVGKSMMTSSNRNIFHVTGPLWGEYTGHRWIPIIKASDAESWCFFDLRLNNRLSKQSRRRWFETQSRLLWSHCNDSHFLRHLMISMNEIKKTMKRHELRIMKTINIGERCIDKYSLISCTNDKNAFSDNPNYWFSIYLQMMVLQSLCHHKIGFVWSSPKRLMMIHCTSMWLSKTYQTSVDTPLAIANFDYAQYDSIREFMPVGNSMIRH